MQGRSLRAAAFTLVEVLVAVGIIVILVALLFPAFVKVRAVAKQAICIGQLRQIGMAMLIYAEDNGGLAPHLSTLYPAYLSNPAVFLCPSDPAAGKHDADEYMEGRLHLASGVSYT